MVPHFFAQDESCHWYMIPVHLKEEFYKGSELDEDSEEFFEWIDKFSYYLTGGGIENIYFIPINK